MTLDWSAGWKPEWEQERDALIRAHQQQSAQDGPQSDPLPSPALTAKTQGLAPRAAPATAVTRLEQLRTEQPAVVRPPDPVEMLDAALDTAADDTERAALLAAAPRPVRERLNAMLVYKELMRSAEDDPYAAFERALDAASDDATRRALIAGRDAAFLAEWAWRVRASADDWRRRYLELIDAEL